MAIFSVFVEKIPLPQEWSAVNYLSNQCSQKMCLPMVHIDGPELFYSHNSKQAVAESLRWCLFNGHATVQLQVTKQKVAYAQSYNITMIHFSNIFDYCHNNWPCQYNNLANANKPCDCSVLCLHPKGSLCRCPLYILDLTGHFRRIFQVEGDNSQQPLLPLERKDYRYPVLYGADCWDTDRQLFCFVRIYTSDRRTKKRTELR